MRSYEAVTTSLTLQHARVWRPSVVATLAYGSLYTVFCLWMLLTWRADSFHGQVLGGGILGVPLVHVFTGVNVLWLGVLALDLREAGRAPLTLRRAHTTGVVLAIIVVLAMEVSVLAMHDAALAWAPR